MTGLWQVLGRNDIPFEEMVKLDYRYVTALVAAGRPQADAADGADPSAPELRLAVSRASC